MLVLALTTLSCLVLSLPGRLGAARGVSGRVDVALTKRLPGFTLDVAWTAGDGVVVLFGPSGAGKSLTLQCLAGLDRPDARPHRHQRPRPLRRRARA